ncbi:NADH-dependent flavin oxidoreductase [Halobacteriales archaeon QH_2_66_30]|nr:MAG: NADH-dependent flavin oxidoreductase [Halobacteriales archaeon QH_2_66_30]
MTSNDDPRRTDGSRLTDPLTIGGVELPNRLYRAPLLECAGNGPDAVETFVDELEPAAEAGAGLIFQGASIVTGEGGCAAPNMTRVHDPEFVDELSRLTDRVHEHDSRIFIQLAHGGLRSLDLWHAEHRRRNPGATQAAVSRPPWQLRLADRAGIVDLRPDVLSTAEVRELAAAFGRAAGYAVDAGYDGIHLSGANMGIIQQFLSPHYNDRDDEFADGVRFLLAVRDAVREHAEAGYDALVPVEVSTYWDMSVIRGAFPERAWKAEELQDDYAAVFGGEWQARAVQALNRLEGRWYPSEPGWNAAFCRAVREAVDVPVLCEGGIRERAHCERLLGGEGASGDGAGSEQPPACDMVGMGRPFYAEPRLPARLLAGEERVLCESCNNCTVPQAAGEPGRCRTPEIVRERARREGAGEYERTENTEGSTTE